MPAVDNWSGKSVAIVSAADPAGTSFSSEQINECIRRARLLQLSDHAHLQRVLDFHFGNGRFILVIPHTSAVPLPEFLTANQPSDSQLLELISNYLSVLIYLELHTPNLVPPFEVALFYVNDDGSLIMQNYQLQFLFGPQANNALAEAAKFIELIVPHVDDLEKRKQLSDLIERARSPQGGFGTVHKLRTALRHLIDQQLQAHTVGRTADA